MTKLVSSQKLRRYFLKIIEEDYERGLVKHPEVRGDAAEPVFPGYDSDYLKAYYVQREFPRIHHFLNTFFKNREKSKILSVGCGGAAYMEIYLKYELDHSVIGADLKSTVLEWAKRNTERGFQLIPCNLNIDELPFEKNSFDIVIFTEVLEHLKCNPDIVLQKFHAVLRNNGSLLLPTPNIASGGNIKALVRGRNFLPPVDEEFFQIDSKKGHFRLYIIDELIDILKRNGFEPKSINMFSPYGTGLGRFRALSYYLPKFRKTIMVESLKKTYN